MIMNIQSEGVRIPMWITTILVALVLPAATALLTGVEWRTASLQAIASVGVLLGGTEAARRNVYSQDTQTRTTTAALMAGRLDGWVDRSTPDRYFDDDDGKDLAQQAVLDAEDDDNDGQLILGQDV